MPIVKYQKGVPIRISSHFLSTEFDCNCAYPECAITYIDTDHMAHLEQKRLEINKEIIIRSGYRCARYNEKVGGKSGSYHLIGKATDIVCHTDEMAVHFEDFDGYAKNLKEGFIHCDSRGYRARWTY